MPSQTTGTREVSLHTSDDDATRLHEIVRLVAGLNSLNAKGSALHSSTPPTAIAPCTNKRFEPCEAVVSKRWGCAHF